MASEKTEKATARRRQRALDQGQFAYSQEVTAALTLFAALTTLSFLYVNSHGFRSFFERMLESAITADTDTALLVTVRQAGVYFLSVVAPIFAATVVAALVGNFAQGLPVFAKDGAGLKFERLNPIQGLSRLKSRVSPLEWGKMLVLVVIASVVTWKTYQLYWPELVSAVGLNAESSVGLIRSMLLHMITYIGIAVGILAVGDFFIQRFRFEKSIKQTKPEVKEDMKATEGNPTIKGKIRSIQRDRARQRMMARVKDADVIVTNPTHYAVALQYKPEMGAPRVLAKGVEWLAQRIKEEGRLHDIPTVENVPLARALYRSVEVDQEIPSELYKAVAEVLAFVFKARKHM
ncbi:MAG TPA: EscU/YscU/HrcU family type III secretion system export apparatus switch protein [Terriglobia bacterium]|nr:EscU/YscU/HrcU family type III secretion system export apparatus switch protein [Terriglobia bacterium]